MAYTIVNASEVGTYSYWPGHVSGLPLYYLVTTIIFFLHDGFSSRDFP